MATGPKELTVLLKYLRTDFPIQKDLDLSQVLDSTKSKVNFTYKEVKEALLQIKTTDPGLHNNMCWLWQSTRTRTDIAQGTFQDSSTLKRKWNKGMYILFNYLVNSEICGELEPIDILYIEAKQKGTLHNM